MNQVELIAYVEGQSAKIIQDEMIESPGDVEVHQCIALIELPDDCAVRQKFVYLVDMNTDLAYFLQVNPFDQPVPEVDLVVQVKEYIKDQIGASFRGAVVLRRDNDFSTVELTLHREDNGTLVTKDYVVTKTDTGFWYKEMGV